MNKPMTTLIGHRGLPSQAPENTRASIEAAHQAGIQWLELDVTMAADHSLVIMHDNDLRLFGLPDIRLADTNRAQLQTVDAGRWFDPRFSGEPLLFLEQLLPLMRALNLSMNLEIKINPDLPIIDQVNNICRQLQAADCLNPQLVISSFHHDALREVRRRCPEAQLAPLFAQLPVDAVADTADLQPVSIHCDYRILTEASAAQIAQHLPLYCYTVNAEATLRQLLNWGVSGVFSDRANAEDLRQLCPEDSTPARAVPEKDR